MPPSSLCNVYHRHLPDLGDYRVCGIFNAFQPLIVDRNKDEPIVLHREEEYKAYGVSVVKEDEVIAD
jgi:hypothetical protein